MKLGWELLVPRGASFSSVFYQTPGASLGLTLLSANPSKINLHKRHFELPCCTKTKIQSHFHPHGAPAVPWEQKISVLSWGFRFLPRDSAREDAAVAATAQGWSTRRNWNFSCLVLVFQRALGECARAVRDKVLKSSAL